MVACMCVCGGKFVLVRGWCPSGARTHEKMTKLLILDIRVVVIVALIGLKTRILKLVPETYKSVHLGFTELTIVNVKCNTF